MYLLLHSKAGDINIITTVPHDLTDGKSIILREHTYSSRPELINIVWRKLLQDLIHDVEKHQESQSPTGGQR